MKYLLLFLSILSTQAQFLSGGRGGSGGSGGGGTPVASALYYVSTNGNDSTAVAGDATKPYATISKAVSNSVNNAVIYVLPGVYTHTPYLVQEPDIDDLSTAGTINLISKTNITIRGPGAIVYGAGQGDLMIIKDSDNITIDGLTFWGNRPTTNAVCVATNYGHVFLCGGMDNILFKGCIFKSFGQFGICSTDNINESGNDNANRINVEGCIFQDGGATNVTGGYSRGASYGARARNISFVGNTCDNVLRGVVAYNQVNLGVSTATNTTVKVVNNTFNSIWEGVLNSAILASGLSFTNDQTVIFTGNNLTDIGLDFPNNIGSPTTYGLFLSAAKKVLVANNSFVGNYNLYCVVLTPLIRRSSLTFTDNLVKNSVFGIAATQYYETMNIDGCIVSGNTFDNLGASAVYLTGDNSTVVNNVLMSVCTNSATYGSYGQIQVAGSFSGLNSTNVLVRGNSFADNIVGLPGNSTIFVADTNSFDIRFEDNSTVGRLSSLTNRYIQHLGTGRVKHTYNFSTPSGTTTHTHHFNNTNGQAGFVRVDAVMTGTIGGTNHVGAYTRNGGFRNYLGTNSFGAGTENAMNLEDVPINAGAVALLATNDIWTVTLTGVTSIACSWKVVIDCLLGR